MCFCKLGLAKIASRVSSIVAPGDDSFNRLFTSLTIKGKSTILDLIGHMELMVVGNAIATTGLLGFNGVFQDIRLCPFGNDGVDPLAVSILFGFLYRGFPAVKNPAIPASWLFFAVCGKNRLICAGSEAGYDRSVKHGVNFINAIAILIVSADPLDNRFSNRNAAVNS